MAWGKRYLISVYIADGAGTDSDDLLRAVDTLSEMLDSDFIGVRVEVVEEEPQDQIAT